MNGCANVSWPEVTMYQTNLRSLHSIICIERELVIKGLGNAEFFSNLIFLHVLVVSLRWIDQREQSFVASQIDAGPYLFILAVGK